MWERFKAWVAEMCVLRDAPCRSCCVQLCLDSAFQRQKNACAPMRFWIVARLLISGESMPIVANVSAARGFSRPRAVVCGHYYCVGPKMGSFFCTCGAQLPFKHFPSHPHWITNCGRSEKFPIASARIERMECAKMSRRVSTF